MALLFPEIAVSPVDSYPSSYICVGISCQNTQYSLAVLGQMAFETGMPAYMGSLASFIVINLVNDIGLVTF